MDRPDGTYGIWGRRFASGNVLEIGGCPGEWRTYLTGHGYRMQAGPFPFFWMAKLAFPIARFTYRGAN